jgi:L-ascorbate metabolism protein UlaG (beta-lactamase superfamily)
MPQPAARPVQVTHSGGPTVLLEIGRLRLLTDPTFDPAGSHYASKPAPRVKTADPTISVAQLGQIDAILLSHEQHFDNLDHAGRAYLPQAGQILTTPTGAQNLGGQARGMKTWETAELTAPNGLRIQITAMPARHGPAAIQAAIGDVTGWMLEWEGQQHGALYISGDTVLYEAIVEISQRYQVGTAFLHFGASRVDLFGPDPLSLTGQAGVACANLFAKATIVPLHYEGWSHLTEGRPEIEQAFAAAGLTQRLRFLPFGQTVALNV